MENTRNILLNPKERTQEIVDAIDQTYNEIKNQNSEKWNHRGRYSYNFFHVSEFKLIERIIRSTNSQKEFIFMDIGAGNCIWGRACANYLNTLKDLADDIEIIIISLTGDNEKDITKIKKDGICTIYEYDKFKIECLSTELKKYRFNLNNRVDLCVSSYTFIHLVDLYGTFAQIFNLLRPISGLFLFDEFDFSHKIIPMLGVPYLSSNIVMVNYRRESNNYIIKRNNKNKCILPILYNGLHSENVIDKDGTKYVKNKAIYSFYNEITNESPNLILGKIKLPKDYIYFREDKEFPVSNGFVQFEGDDELFNLIANL